MGAWGWQSPSRAKQARCWNTKCSAVPWAALPAGQSGGRYPSPSTRHDEQVTARLPLWGWCAVQCPWEQAGSGPGSGQEQGDTIHDRGMHCVHRPGHLPSASVPALPVTSVGHRGVGTLLLSGAASVTARPNSCAGEGALPARHHPRNLAPAKPGAGGGHTGSATGNQDGRDMEVRGWGPQVLTSQLCCAGTAARSCLR